MLQTVRGYHLWNRQSVWNWSRTGDAGWNHLCSKVKLIIASNQEHGTGRMSKTDIADERTKQIVDAAIDALNEQRTPHQRISKDPGTILLGPHGKLDSIGLVNLVVMLEDRCQEHCGAPVSLTDAISGENVPFDSIATLTAYLHRRLTQEM
jgi:hypothetical protein